MGWTRRPFRGILVDEVLLPVQEDRATCPFEGAGAATDPYPLVRNYFPCQMARKTLPPWGLWTGAFSSIRLSDDAFS